jgi:hypothetical protein
MTKSGRPYDSCHEWGQSATRDVLKMHPDVVITTARPVLGTPDHPTPGARAWTEIGAGAAQYWKQFTDAGIKVVAIKETPEMGRNIPDCLSAPDGSSARCATPTSSAVLHGTPLEQAVAHTPTGAFMVDLNRHICGPEVCSPVVGNVVVYRDEHHLTKTYAATLLPYLREQLLATGAFTRQ